MTSFLKSFFGNLLGDNSSISTDEKIDIPFLDKNSKYKFAKGIALKDEHGIRAAKSYGWVIALNTLYKHFDQTEHYFRIGTQEQDTNIIKSLSDGVLHALYKRTGFVPAEFYRLTDSDRLSTGNDIVSQCFSNIDPEITEKVKKHLRTGYIICDVRRGVLRDYEIKKENEKAIELIKLIAAETNTVIPIVATSM